jgi:uncharacterized protein (TIGR00661 family)
MKIVMSLAESDDGTWGGLARFRPIADAFLDQGHDVVFFMPEKMKKRLSGERFKVFSTPESTFLGLPGFISDYLTSHSAEATPPVREGKDFGSIWLVYRLKGMAKTSYLRKLVERELSLLDELKPDLLVSNLDLALFLASRIRQIPLATMYASIKKLGTGGFSWKRVNNTIRKVSQSFGVSALTPEELCYGDDVLKIVPSIPELEDLSNESNVHFIGSLYSQSVSKSQQPFVPEKGKRYIFVYLGTGALPFHVVRREIQHFMSDKPDHICIVSSQTVKQREVIGNVEFTFFIPAAELLPHCDLVISHGGLNTIIQSLTFGVPLLLFPGSIFERRYNARKVQSLGAGIMGEASNFTKQWLDVAFKTRGQYKEGAKKMIPAFDGYGGAEQAVQVMMEWVEEARHLERP